jgi:predicted anti-sigma-YlaC factor YlaD
MRRCRAAAALAVFGASNAACSPATMGLNRMANTLADTADAYGRDDDPEFVRVGAPATLKMIEMLLETNPAHPALLQSACSGFTQYAYAFLQVDSELLARTEARVARELRGRAERMYARAKRYCLRLLAIRHPALPRELLEDPRNAPQALARATAEDVPALFWTGTAWAGELASTDDQLVRLVELATIRDVLSRALALDERWGDGAIHEAMIAMEGLPALAGGSPVRAKAHFDRAVALADGQSAFAYVTMATSVALPARDRSGFETLLKQALAIDVARKPGIRLANLVAQKRARFLLANAGALFGGSTVGGGLR